MVPRPRSRRRTAPSSARRRRRRPGRPSGWPRPSTSVTTDAARARTASIEPAWTPTGHSPAAPSTGPLVDADDEPADHAGLAEQRLDPRPLDRDLAHPERPVEDGAREVRRRGGGDLALVEHADVEPGRGRGAPHRQPRLALDAVEEVELEMERGASIRAPAAGRESGRRAGRRPPLRTRAYIRESAGWRRIEIRPDLPPLNAPLMTSHGLAGAAISRTTASPIASRVPTREERQLDPARRQVLADRSRLDAGMAVGPDALDRLDREQATARCGPPWTASWWWASPSSPSRPDPCLGDGELRHAAGREVDLEHASVHRTRMLAGRASRSAEDGIEPLLAGHGDGVLGRQMVLLTAAAAGRHGELGADPPRSGAAGEGSDRRTRHGRTGGRHAGAPTRPRSSGRDRPPIRHG